MNKYVKKLKERIKIVRSSDLNSKIFTHGFWILSGNIISKIALLLATILITRTIGKNEYGQFGIIKSTILMFAMFAGMELGLTATKYISQYRFNDKNKVEAIVGLSNLFAIIISVVISVVVFAFSDLIAFKINAPSLTTEIKLSSFILFFSSLNGIQNGILAGIENFKKLSINNAVAGILSSIAMIVSAKYFSLQELVIAFGLNYVLIFILNFFTLKAQFYKEFSINLFRRRNFDELGVLWRFSLPAILAGIMVGPVTWFCNYLLINEIKGYEEMANFDIANQWRTTILFIPSALAQIALPLLSANINNKKDYINIFNKNLKINFFIAFGMVVVFVLLSPVIIHLYSSTYHSALIPLIIMFSTTGFIAVNNIVGQAIASQGKMWLGLFVNVVWALVLVLFCFVFVVVLKLGAIGLSLAYLISYAVHTFIQFFYIKNRLKSYTL